MRARSANCWGVEWVRTNCSSTSRWSGTSVRGVRPQIKLTHEDEVLVRKPIYQYLRDCGYRVLEAASVDEATLILQKQDIHVDVILSTLRSASTACLRAFAFNIELPQSDLAPPHFSRGETT
jgi:hypothetical protein